MANEQNLIPGAHTLTLEEQSRGGIASGEARRRRKTLKEELLLLLEDGDVQKRISTALLEEAANGNTRAFEVIRDTIGEKPKEQISLETEVIRIGFDDDPAEI